MAIINFLALAVAAYAQQPAQPKPAARPVAAKPAAATAAKQPAARPATPPLKTPPSPGEKVVLKVGKEEVSQAELDFAIDRLSPEIRQTLARQGRRPIGEQYALMLILTGLAVSHRLDSSPDVRQQIELLRVQMLAQAEYENIVGQTKVSPEEVNQYYSAHPDEFDQAQVRQVVIRKKPEGAKEGTPGLLAQEAKTKAEEIRKAFAAGGDTAKATQDLSIPNVVQIDSQPRMIRRGQLPADLDKAAFQLKDGEVSDPFETPQALVLVQVVGRRHLELKEVSNEVENRLREQKVQASVKELRDKTSVWMDEEYFATPPGTPATQTPETPGVGQPPQQ